MNCHRCGGELVRGSPVCPSCGAPAQGACPDCGALNEPEHNFCFSCGHALIGQVEPVSVEERADEPQSEPREVAGLAPPEVASPPAPGVTMVPCPRCRQSNEPGAIYCLACGLPLEDTPRAFRPGLRGIPAFSLGEPGGFGWRLVAFLIDSALMLLVFAVTWPIIGGESVVAYYESIVNPDPAAAAAGPLLRTGDIYIAARDIIYYTAAIAIWQATAGMWVCRLRVLRTDGSRVGVGRSLGRYFASVLSMLLFGVGYLLIIFREDKRALHDLICDTVVIRRPYR